MAYPSHQQAGQIAAEALAAAKKKRKEEIQRLYDQFMEAREKRAQAIAAVNANFEAVYANILFDLFAVLKNDDVEI